jgi:ribosomal protein S18 acetylase RimI-like enzyme
VGIALLEDVLRRAAEGGLRAVSLDTAATNAAAQALYEAAGFTVTDRRPPKGPIPGIVGYVREV